MNRGGLCEACLSPGHCCKKIHLSDTTGALYIEGEQDPVEVVTRKIGQHWFKPLEECHSLEVEGVRRVDYLWECTALGPDGRCTVYENRPQLCRDYVAGTDRLCVHFWSIDGREPV